MTGKNPRITISLTPSLVATLSGISKETGESMSTMVREVLIQSEPAFHRMYELFKAANAAKGQIGGGTGAALAKVVDELEEAMAVADVRVKRATRDLVDSAEKVAGRRRKTVGAARGPAHSTGERLATPRLVTRGVGTNKKGVRGGHAA